MAGVISGGAEMGAAITTALSRDAYPSEHHGTSVADFVIFPPRWLAQGGTFRSLWHHRNTMSESMGLVSGEYDDKKGAAFRAGGASLHHVMAAHGLGTSTFEKASAAELGLQIIGVGSMAFMFESSLMLGLSEWGRETCCKVQGHYNDKS